MKRQLSVCFVSNPCFRGEAWGSHAPVYDKRHDSRGKGMDSTLYSTVTKTTNDRWEEEKIFFNLFIIYFGLFLIQVVFGPVFDLMVFGPFLLTVTSLWLCALVFSLLVKEGPKSP